jgi:hypothetical protein
MDKFHAISQESSDFIRMDEYWRPGIQRFVTQATKDDIFLENGKYWANGMRIAFKYIDCEVQSEEYVDDIKHLLVMKGKILLSK